MTLHFLAFSILTSLLLSGCAIHSAQSESASKKSGFCGKDNLSLAANLELMAGNEKALYADTALNQQDLAELQRARQYLSAQDNDQQEAAAQMAESSRFSLRKALDLLPSLSQAQNAYPKYNAVILLKLEPGQTPDSPTSLQKAFESMLDTQHPRVKDKQCGYQHQTQPMIVCKRGWSMEGSLQFSSLVSFSFARKLNPNLEEGTYAAYAMHSYGFYSDRMDLQHTARANPNLFISQAAAGWLSHGSDSSAGSETGHGRLYTYKVTQPGDAKLKTLVYQYGPEYAKEPAQHIATLR